MNFQDILDRYTDLERLSVAPESGERAGCFSSYDRRSVYNVSLDRYEDWDANDDGSGYLRKNEDGSIVAVELDGPGLIVRSWSALPRDGHIRVWIDHEPQPCVDVPFAAYFDRYGQDIPPMNLPSLVHTLSRGRNSWLPIPFQKHIRIELSPDWGMFYQFTYVLLPPSVSLPRYADMFRRENQIALAALDRRLYARSERFTRHGAKCSERCVRLLPDERREVFRADGAGAIVRMECIPGSESLNGLRLSIQWDGRPTPAVDASLPSFFGQSTMLGRAATLASGVDRHFCYANWYMPYSHGFVLSLHNAGDAERKLTLALETTPLSQSEADERLRFHAKTHAGFWGELERARFTEGGDRWPDWPVLLAKGKGRFCGMQLHVLNTWQNPPQPPEEWFNGKWNRKNVDWWWGEGDEKFFVDGERFPSTFGTGSEDYFGYAWAAEPPFAIFDAPYAAMDMPLDGNGLTSAVRHHIVDDVPFQRGFEAFLEKYKPERWEPEGVCRYQATPFWYQQADTDDAYPRAPDAL